MVPLQHMNYTAHMLADVPRGKQQLQLMVPAAGAVHRLLSRSRHAPKVKHTPSLH
jgi:hypothetical protein